MDANKTYTEKARWELHKNATCHIEQILETTLNKTAVVWPHTSHFTNYPHKMYKTWGTAG